MLEHYSHEKEGNLLGEGSYGRVYGSHSGGRKFALKKFDRRAYGAFVHESEMALKTKSLQTVVQVKKSFISGGNGYLLMEHCISDLFTFIKERNEPLCEEEALRIFYSLCEAVAELHSRSIAHLDLKLENILLTEKGEWKLCDFGSSCSFTRGERKLVRGRIGTPGYAAPEIMANKWFFPEKADSWSLGIILHALLLNCLPYFDSESTDSSFSLNFVYFSSISAASKKLLYNLLAHDPDVRPSAKYILLEYKYFQLQPPKAKETNTKFRKIKNLFKTKASSVLE